jgi:ABC-type multidrug transport system ATPase subunit
MDEAELCDRVALIQKGDILEIDTPDGIVDRFDKKLYKIRTEEIYPTLTALSKMEGFEHSFSFGQEIHMYSTTEIDEKWLEDQLKKQGVGKVVVSKGRPVIEDCFMDLMVRENLLEDVN